MGTHLARRLVALALALLSLGCGSSGATGGGGSAGSQGGAGPHGGGGSANVGGQGDGGGPSGRATFEPKAIGLDGPDVTNSMRGQYNWRGAPPYPEGWKDVEKVTAPMQLGMEGANDAGEYALGDLTVP